MFVRSHPLARYTSSSPLSPLIARSSPSLIDSSRLANSPRLIRPSLCIPLSSSSISSPFNDPPLSRRSYATDDPASTHPLSSPRSPIVAPSQADHQIALIEKEYAFIADCLYNDEIPELSGLSSLLQSSDTPTLFALQIAEALMTTFTQVEQLLTGKKGKGLTARRGEIARAAWVIEGCWKGLLQKGDVPETSREAYGGRLFPDLVMIATKCEDWTMLSRISGYVASTMGMDENVEFGEQLVTALSAYLNFLPASEAVNPKFSSDLIHRILHLILISRDGPRLSLALNTLWPALVKHAELVPTATLGRLLRAAGGTEQTTFADDIWNVIRERGTDLDVYAQSYIELLANTGRTSEIPRVMHLLIDQRLPSHRPWKAALRSHSDPIAAARFLIGFRADLPEPLLIRLVDQLVSSEWGEGVASREETMKEVRSMLEEAFGADVWAKVDATVERGKAKV